MQPKKRQFKPINLNVENKNPVKWYHGTHVRLEPGEYVLPAKGSAKAKRQTEKSSKLYDASHAYITKHYDTAAHFSADRNQKNTGDKGFGYVYEVEPVGEVHPDRVMSGEGTRAGQLGEHRVSAARVKRVVKEGDPVHGPEAKKAFKSKADTDSQKPGSTLHPNSGTAKCASCGSKVENQAGVYVKTGLPAPAKKYEVHHRECLGI